MGKTDKCKKKTAAKVARAKEKIARKCGKAAKVVIAIACLSVLFAGCQGTSTPSLHLPFRHMKESLFNCGRG